MSRKKTNLDTLEAEYLYANVLVEYSKYESFQELSILERNNWVDKVCADVVRKSCKNEEHVEAITQEILSYKLSKEEIFYGIDVYTSGLEKPESFNKLLEKRYNNKIVELVWHNAKSYLN